MTDLDSEKFHRETNWIKSTSNTLSVSNKENNRKTMLEIVVVVCARTHGDSQSVSDVTRFICIQIAIEGWIALVLRYDCIVSIVGARGGNSFQ